MTVEPPFRPLGDDDWIMVFDLIADLDLGDSIRADYKNLRSSGRFSREGSYVQLRARSSLLKAGVVHVLSPDKEWVVDLEMLSTSGWRETVAACFAPRADGTDSQQVDTCVVVDLMNELAAGNPSPVDVGPLEGARVFPRWDVFLGGASTWIDEDWETPFAAWLAAAVVIAKLPVDKQQYAVALVEAGVAPRDLAAFVTASE